MAASDTNGRRANQAELARHAASGEAAAFFATLLGILNEAEAAQHARETRPPEAHPASPSVHGDRTMPTQPAPSDHLHGNDAHQAAMPDAPAVESTPVSHVHATATAPVFDTPAAPHAAPDDAPAHISGPSPSPSAFDAPADHASSVEFYSAHGSAAAPASANLGAAVPEIADTVSGFVDSSLAAVTHVVAGLSSTVNQLASSLSSTASHLADGLTSAVTNLFHDAPAAVSVEPLLTDILGSATGPSTQVAEAAHHDVGLLDTASVVPTLPIMSPAPLHLGFLGQPTSDGHDVHDGAFSALGVHHF